MDELPQAPHERGELTSGARQFDLLTRAQHFDDEHAGRQLTACSALSAAPMLMLTWSSLFADVGIVSAEAA